MKYYPINYYDYEIVENRTGLTSLPLPLSNRFCDFSLSNAIFSDWEENAIEESNAIHNACIMAAIEASMKNDMYCGYYAEGRKK